MTTGVPECSEVHVGGLLGAQKLRPWANKKRDIKPHNAMRVFIPVFRWVAMDGGCDKGAGGCSSPMHPGRSGSDRAVGSDAAQDRRRARAGSTSKETRQPGNPLRRTPGVAADFPLRSPR